MKRALFLLILLTGLASAQTAGSFQYFTHVAAGSNVIKILPFTPVVVCGFPATGGTPCTNLQQTYTNPTAQTTCPLNAQLIMPGTSTCSSTSDADGNFSFFAQAPTSVTYEFQYLGNWFGPYIVTIGNPGANLSIPPPIGNITPNTGSFTTLAGTTANITTLNATNGTIPTLGSTTATIATANITTATISALTSSTSLSLSFLTGTQCLHEVNGVVSGTGQDCGAGGGGGSPGGSKNNLQTNNGSSGFSAITNVASGSVLASQGSTNAPVFQTTPWIDPRNFATPADCTGGTDSYTTLNANIVAGANVMLPAGCVLLIGTNWTIPATATIQFGAGSMLAPKPGIQVIVSGSVIAGDRQQIVSLTSGGTVQFRGSARVMVDWYGAANDGVTDDCTAVNTALASGARDLILVKANGTPYLGADVIDTPDYYTSCTWRMQYSGQTLEGNTNETWSAGVTILGAAGINVIQLDPSCVGCRIAQFQEFGGGKPMEGLCYNGNPVVNPFTGVGDGILVYGGEPVLDRVQANCNARNGIHIDGTNVVINGSAGQPDDWSMIRVYTNSNQGNNIYIHGGDSSAGYADGLIMYFSGQAGLADDSPFGDSFVSTFTTADGRDPGVAAGVASNISTITCNSTTCSVVAATAVAGIQNHIWIIVAGTTNHNGTFWVSSFTDSQHFAYALVGGNTSTESVGTVRTDSSSDVYANATRTVFDGSCTAGSTQFTSQSAQFGMYSQVNTNISIAGAGASGATLTTTGTPVNQYTITLGSACTTTVTSAQTTFSGGIDHGPMINTDPSSVYSYNYWEADQPSAIVAQSEVFIGGLTPFQAAPGQFLPMQLSAAGSTGSNFFLQKNNVDSSGGFETQCGKTVNEQCGLFVQNFNGSAQFGFYTPNFSELFISIPGGIPFSAQVGGALQLSSQAGIILDTASTASQITTNSNIFANFTNTAALTLGTSGNRFESIATCGANCTGIGGSGGSTGIPGDWVAQFNDSGSFPVDYFSFTNAITGNPATLPIAAAGTDSNISISLTPKGSGTISIPALTLSSITGSTQCLQVNTNGLVSGTNSGCGSGGGGGNVTNANQFDAPYYSQVGSANQIAGMNWLTGIDGVSQYFVEQTTGGAQTTPVPLPAGVPINTVSGSGTYTNLKTDRASLVQYNNGSAIAVTRPQASTGGFANNWVNLECNTGAGTATVTPTTSTITTWDGVSSATAQTSLAIPTGTCAFWYSDNTNYLALLIDGNAKSINGSAVAASVPVLATNGSKQIVAATGHNIVTPLNCADTSASGTAQSCNTSPTFTPGAGDCVIYTTTTANTGTGLTINVNSLGAKSVAKYQTVTTLAPNDVRANTEIRMCYDGTNFEMDAIGNAPSGVSTLTGDGALISNSGSTGAVTLTLGTATAHTWWGRSQGTNGAPAYNTIGTGDLPAAVVYNNATNTFTSAGTVDLSAATGANALKAPSQAGLTSNGTSSIGYDTTNKNFHIPSNGVDSFAIAAPAAGSFTNNDCVKFQLAAGVLTVADAGNACANGTPTFPVTVAGTVTSGGIPYFSGTTTESSSALLAANAIIVGGGAGGTPATGNADFTYSAHTLSAAAAGLVDFSGMTGANAFKIPSQAGLTSNGTSSIAYDTTGKLFHLPTNGADSTAIVETGTSTTTSQVLHATAVAGVGTFSAIATGDLPAAVVLNNATNTFTSAGTVDLSAGGTNALKVPSSGGLTSNGTSSIAYDTTNKNLHIPSNGVDSFAGALPASGSYTNNDCVALAVASGVVTLADAGSGCGGVSGAYRILTKTANYVTSSGDFSSSNQNATIVDYTVSSATTVTHTLPNTVTSTGTFEIVRNDCASTFGLYVAPANSLTLDGDTTDIFLEPCDQISIISNGTNWITDLKQNRAASTGGMFFPAIPAGSSAISTGYPFTTVANTPFVTRFYLDHPIKVAKMTVVVQVGVASCVLDMAIADVGKNILAHYSSGQACTGGGNDDTAVNTTLTLAPGVYYLAGCTNSTTTLTLSAFPLGVAITNFQQVAESGSVGTAANLCTAGVFTNTSLGTITNSLTPNNIPTVWAHP